MTTLGEILFGVTTLVTLSSLVHADTRAGLIAHYPFDGTADDASGNGHHGTANGPIPGSDRFGLPNHAFLFDGVDDFIQVADTQALRLAGTDYTIAAWVQEESRDVSWVDSIASKRLSPCDTCGWIFGIRGQADPGREGRLWLHLSGGDSPHYAHSDTEVPLGSWHHVAVVYAESGSMTFYIDGQFDGQASNLPTPDADTNIDLFIGRDSHTAGYHFDGSLDDLRIYDRALSAVEIADLVSSSTSQGYCFGDLGVDTPCPCSNDNDGTVPGSGCANGVFASGAQLTGSGVASVSADTLVLATTGLEPLNSGLYFQAENDLSPGNIWGDGLRCAGADLRRLGVRFSDSSGYSDTSGYAYTISTKAGNILAGQTKYYQCWYRNSTASPCGFDFNASNGYAITWLP